MSSVIPITYPLDFRHNSPMREIFRLDQPTTIAHRCRRSWFGGIPG